MSTTESKIPLRRAQMIADRFITYLSPFCSKVCVAGSVRREAEYCGDVEVCALPLDEFSMIQAFPPNYPGLVVDGGRLKRFKYPDKGLQIELYLPQSFDYGRILAIRTGNAAYARMQLMTQANRLGWIGTSDGLRRKKECEKRGGVWKILPEYKLSPTKPPEFPDEESFFEFIQIPWVHPKERSWITQKAGYDYSK